MKALGAGNACAALLFVFMGSTAHGTPIPIDITGHLEGNVYRYSMIGPGFEYRISTAEGPLIVGLCQTTPCSIEASYSAGVPSVQFANTATLHGLHAPQTGGEIRLSFPLAAGAAAPGQTFSSTVPISLFAQITGFQGEVASTNRGEALFIVNVRGAGNATVFGRTFADGSTVVQGADFTIEGTADQVPEPATFALVGAGLVSLAVFLRRRAVHR